MITRKVWFAILLIGAALLIVGLTPRLRGASAAPMPQAAYTLQGRVYKGDTGTEPPTSSPIQGVTVSLYCSNNQGVQGTFLRSTTTDSTGWYGLEVYDTDVCEFFNIIETDLDGYISVGATTVGGNVVNANWIEYTAPLDGQTLTGNKFWDKLPVLSGRVYEGDVGDESTPLAGVTVSLYGAGNPYPDPGTFIISTTTDSTGWYGLEVPPGYEYYHILETDPDGYISVGASTISGSVMTENWIEFVIPLTELSYTGNKFWDKLPVLSGRVYEGDVGDESTPLAGVTVSLYGANNPYPDQGTFIISTTTDSTGWYGLEAPPGYEYYHIIETDPDGYVSAGATTVSGTVRTANWIEYAYPLPGQTFTGNKFWDQVPIPDLTIAAAWFEEASICYYVENIGTGTAPAGHRTLLTIDGSPQADQAVEVELGPDEGWVGCFEYTSCTGISDTVTVSADHTNVVTESNETNNTWETTRYCDITPPEIISGPIVVETTPNSALIYWRTDELSDSLVRYGQLADHYTAEVADPTLVETHTIVLADLEPATTYHFAVQSADASGNTTQSQDMLFETQPALDEEDPTVSLTVPEWVSGTVTITAAAEDNEGVEKVEFYLDGELVFTDYSPPYEFPLDTTRYPNGDYEVRGVVYDLSGRFTEDIRTFNVDNLQDMTSPIVTITSPQDGATVSGKVTVTVVMSDDTGLANAFFYVDGVYIGFSPFASHPTNATEHFVWDTTQVTDGSHRFGVMVYDTDSKSGIATVDVTVNNGPPPSPPNLIVTKHTVTRQQNAINVELVVKNIGTGEAKNVYIQDFLQAFQPTSRSTTIPTPADYEAEFIYLTKMNVCSITDYTSIKPGEVHTYTYSAVPVMIYPNPPTPSVGNTVELWYEDSGGGSYHKQVSAPVPLTTGGETIQTAHQKALQQADYLIVTNPQRLFWLNPGHSDDVNAVLAEMAQMAVYESGALGYLYTNNRNTLDSLVRPTGTWAKALHPDFRTAAKGYLLLVGETEIIPSWRLRRWNITWNNSTCRTREVDLTDLPYADTGGNGAPELIVGRIIGNTAADLLNVLRTSNRVYGGWPGYGFDRSDALLVSGIDSNSSIQNTFKRFVDGVAKSLKSEFTVTKLHWSSVAADPPRVSCFRNSTGGKDLICYQGHGSPDGWGPLSTGDILTPPITFSNTNPIVIGLACLTGSYEDHVANSPCSFNGGDDNLAEAFLDRGAAVYIGSTEVSPIWHNTVAGGDLLTNKWKPYTTIGKALTDLKRDKWSKDMMWQFWVTEYNLYGDPKYGYAHPGLSLASSPRPQAPPASSQDVIVPDYVVTTTEGIDYVEIPGGDLLLDVGQYRIPYYSISLDYPQGYKVQDVTLVDRSGLVTDTGLHIPTNTLDIALPTADVQTSASQSTVWVPEEEYRWDLLENPDGSSTLIITMYPFYYNPYSTDVMFYKNYSFAINYITTPVTITLTTDKDTYQPGEDVAVDLDLHNAGEAQDVVVNVLVKQYPTGEVMDSLLLDTLEGLSGEASFSTVWDSSGVESGLYYAEVTLKDTSGTVLDRRMQMFQVGSSTGEVGGLTVTPEQFDIGEAVSISLVFSNTGTMPITGTVVIRVQDDTGETVQEFKNSVSNLSPGNVAAINNVWDTTGATPGTYDIVGYALYESTATDPVTAQATARARVYLPLILKAVP